MRNRTYSRGVEWIAHNDEPLEMRVEEMEGLISVQLLAHLYDVPAKRVAQEVISYRVMSARHPGGTT